MMVLVLLQQKWGDLAVWLRFGTEISLGPHCPSQNLSAWGQIFARNFIVPIILE